MVLCFKECPTSCYISHDTHTHTHTTLGDSVSLSLSKAAEQNKSKREQNHRSVHHRRRCRRLFFILLHFHNHHHRLLFFFFFLCLLQIKYSLTSVHSPLPLSHCVLFTLNLMSDSSSPAYVRLYVSTLVFYTTKCHWIVKRVSKNVDLFVLSPSLFCAQHSMHSWSTSDS